MNEHEVDQNWSFFDSRKKSIDDQFETLYIKGNCDFSNENNDIIQRKNPVMKTSISQCCETKKEGYARQNKTSDFVLTDLIKEENNLELSKSSGYNSLLSPFNGNVNDNLMYGSHQSLKASSTFSPHNQSFESHPDNFVNNYHQSMTKTIKDLIIYRLCRRKRFKEGNKKFIFEFGDTNLIKSCRVGQLLGVQQSLNELLEYHQIQLIDHQNLASQTPLSIAIYKMDEDLIKLLIKNYASPILPLTMNNNVLHLAAAMEGDTERKTIKYLINAIREYQPECLLIALTAKNQCNYNVSDILRFYQKKNINNFSFFYCIQNLLDFIQHIIQHITQKIN